MAKERDTEREDLLAIELDRVSEDVLGDAATMARGLSATEEDVSGLQQRAAKALAQAVVNSLDAAADKAILASEREEQIKQQIDLLIEEVYEEAQRQALVIKANDRARGDLIRRAARLVAQASVNEVDDKTEVES